MTSTAVILSYANEIENPTIGGLFPAAVSLVAGNLAFYWGSFVIVPQAGQLT